MYSSRRDLLQVRGDEMLAAGKHHHVAEPYEMRVNAIDLNTGRRRFKVRQSPGAALVCELHAAGNGRGRAQFGVQIQQAQYGFHSRRLDGM